ncbi:MAG: P-II family nitrogen regulator [Bacillota bacterium]
MKKIECIFRPSKLEQVKEALSMYGINGMTVTHVIGCGIQKGKTELYRGSEYSLDLLPKVKIEIIIKDELVRQVIDIISSAAKTGQIGDGKIFVYDVETAIRIRTGETGDDAI